MELGKWATWYNIVLVILAIIVVVDIIRRIWCNIKVDRIATWPKVSAKVLRVGVMVQADEDIVADMSVGTKKNMNIHPEHLSIRETYVPHIVYEYSVGGKYYVSNNFAYGEKLKYNGDEIRSMISGITPGSMIDVYYDDSDPAESYVHPGKKNYMGIVFGFLILAALGAIMVYYNSDKLPSGVKKYVPEGMTKNKYNMSFDSDSLKNYGYMRGGGLY